MASIINASSSGSGGIVQTADASGVLQLQSNGTVALTVSGQNIGIANLTPSAWGSYYPAIQANPASAFTFASSANDVQIASNVYQNNSFQNLYATTGQAATKYIGSATNGNHTFLSSGTSGTAGNQITDFPQVLAFGKNITVALQGATTQSGTGISFPATQSASTNANTLDDYEEGTWTPTLTADVNPSSVSYAAQTGRYTKIGNTVTIWVYFSINSYTGGSGASFISGLPFTCNGDVQGGMSLNWANNGFVSTVAFAAHIPVNQARGYFVYLNGGATTQLPLTQWTAGTQFIATGSYQV